MGIKKVITLTYVCDNKNCKKAGEDESLFATKVNVQNGDDKKSAVLCDDCKDEHDKFMARYFGEEDEEETPEVVDYDPQTYPQMQKLEPAQRTFHFEAKRWALGPDSTMPKSQRPGGVRGLAPERVLMAYAAYVAEREKDLAEIEAGVAAAKAANGKST